MLLLLLLRLLLLPTLVKCCGSAVTVMQRMRQVPC
jgi:hypothetical protein